MTVTVPGGDQLKYESPKEYLYQATLIDQRINAKIEYIETLWVQVTRVNKQLKTDLVQESNAKGYSDTIDKIIDLQTETNSLIDELVDLKRQIQREINSLDNVLHCTILTQKYISGMRLSEIAKSVNYTLGYIQNQHGWALESFRKTFPDKFIKK